MLSIFLPRPPSLPQLKHPLVHSYQRRQLRNFPRGRGRDRNQGVALESQKLRLLLRLRAEIQEHDPEK